MKKGFLGISKTANLLGVSIQTIRRWDRKGKIKSIRHPINRYRLFRLIELEQLVKKIEEA